MNIETSYSLGRSVYLDMLVRAAIPFLGKIYHEQTSTWLNDLAQRPGFGSTRVSGPLTALTIVQRRKEK